MGKAAVNRTITIICKDVEPGTDVQKLLDEHYPKEDRKLYDIINLYTNEGFSSFIINKDLEAERTVKRDA